MQMRTRKKAIAGPKPRVYSERGAKHAEKLRGMIYKSTNYLAVLDKDIEPDGSSKAILRVAIEYEKKYMGKWRGRHFPRPADLERYFLWLSATASRENEPFLKPYPKIEIIPRRKNLPWKVIHIHRQILKAFEPGSNKQRHEWIHQYIPVFDATEEKIWKKVLNDYDATDLDDLFERLSKHIGKSRSTRNLTHIIQNNFKADQKVSRGKDKGKLIKNAGISPHLIRHHRIYNWKIERRLPDSHLMLLMGWKDESMPGYYAYMNERIKGMAQLQSLEQYARERGAK